MKEYSLAVFNPSNVMIFLILQEFYIFKSSDKILNQKEN